MRGVYEATYKISSLNAAKTLMYITAASGKPCEILSAQVTNCTNETNEQCEISIHKVSALGSPTSTAVTPTKTEQADQACSATVRGEVTASEPTYTSAPNIEVGRAGFASLAGYQYAPVPEERVLVTGGDTWGIRLLNSPTSFDAVVVLRFREMG